MARKSKAKTVAKKGTVKKAAAAKKAPVKRTKRACKMCGRKGFNSRTCGGKPSSHDDQ